MRARLLHVITGLGHGGAESSLARIVGRLDAGRFESKVAGLGPDGPAGSRIRESGVEVTALGADGPLAAARAALGLVRLATRFRPDLVQGWMYHGNLAATVAAAACGRRRTGLVWGIRQALYDYDQSSRATRAAIRLSATLSGFPDRVLYNASEAARQHAASGFRARASIVVPNGYDVAEYAPAPEAREGVRASLGIDPSSEVVGMIARWHPIKNHAGFVAAAGSLASRRPRARFVLCGPGVDASNRELTRTIAEAALSDRFLLLGPRDDLPRLVAALDVATLSSHGEAFPNAIAEAMAAGIPCVAPEVGDVPDLVGETGIVVRRGDSEALAAGWEAILSLGEERRRALGAAARERIRTRFGIERAVSSLEAVYAEVLAR